MKSKEQLINALKIVREKVCCYNRSDHRCDCKYGLSEETIERHPKAGYILDNPGSEQTGCPELREVIWLLECLSDEDIQDVIKLDFKRQKMKEAGIIELWHSGHMATGCEGIPTPAWSLGKFKADTMEDAVAQYNKSIPKDHSKIEKGIDIHGKPYFAIWACRIYDNEKDARNRAYLVEKMVKGLE